MKQKRRKESLWELAHFDLEEFQKIIADYGQIKERLRCKLVSREMYTDYFTNGPRLKHPMGEVLLFLEVEKRENAGADCHVNYEMIKKWGRSEQELMSVALKNTEKYEKSTLRDLDTVLSGYTGEEMSGPRQSKHTMLLLSNEEETYGATAVLYPGVLKQIREQLGMDYYILPTSVHEVTIVPKYSFLDPAEIEKMIYQDNRETIPPAEVLSDYLFEYTEAKGRLERCSVNGKEKNRNEEAR